MQSRSPLPPQEMVEAAGEDERELAAEMAAAFLNENLPEAIFGAPKAGAGQWASLVRLINPIQGTTLDQMQLEQNEAAFRWAGSISGICVNILVSVHVSVLVAAAYVTCYAVLTFSGV